MTVEPDEDFDIDVITDDDDDDYKPPTEEEFARIKTALKKANAQAKKNRLKLNELLKPDGKSGKEEDGKEGKDKAIDRERIRHEVSEVEETKWKKRVVRQAAKAALLEAGLKGDPGKLARLVDEDEVEVDDDGEITDGLEDQIESIKEDYPDLFKDEETTPPPRGTRRQRIDGGNRPPNPPRKLSSAEKIAQQALRTKRRT